MAGQVLWTTCFPQIHWEDRSDSLCVVYLDQATDKSLSWPGLSSQQAQNLSYQESLVHKGGNKTIMKSRQNVAITEAEKEFNETFTNAVNLINHFILYGNSPSGRLS